LTDYTPELPAATFTFTSGGPITNPPIIAGDPLELSGPWEVIRAGVDPAGGLYIGVAGNTAEAGQRVTVHIAAIIHQGPVQGDVHWGQMLTVASDPTRMVRPLVSGAGSQVIGYALHDAFDAETLAWMSLALRFPGAGPGAGAVWSVLAGEALPAQCVVEVTAAGEVVAAQALSTNAIGTVYNPTAAGERADVHLVGPLLHARVWDIPITPGTPIVAGGGAHVRPVTPADMTDNPRRVLGIALTGAAVQDEELDFVVRH
jgi:hypothetical protein